MPTPFTSIGEFPFCPTAEPKSGYDPFVGAPYDITASSLDTTAKSMRFFWLLEAVSVTIQRSFFDGSTTRTTTASTEIYFRKNSTSGIIEPEKRVCEPELYSNAVGVGSYLTFLSGGATKLHFETPLAAGDLSVYGLTDTWEFFGLTTSAADWGFSDSGTNYVDTTLSIDVDGLTLYGKYITVEDQSYFDSITVDDYSFF